MGWLDKLMGREPEVTPSAPVVAETVAAPRKTGEQVALMSDPQGKRVYHEYFVGECDAGCLFPWECRVYSAAGLAATKVGQSATADAARDDAISWGLEIKRAILEAP